MTLRGVRLAFECPQLWVFCEAVGFFVQRQPEG